MLVSIIKATYLLTQMNGSCCIQTKNPTNIVFFRILKKGQQKLLPLFCANLFNRFSYRVCLCKDCFPNQIAKQEGYAF